MEIKLTNKIHIIPLHIEEKGEEVVNDYIQYVKLGDAIENHPNRYLSLNGDFDTVFTLDLNAFPHILKKRIGEYISDKVEAQKIYEEQVKPIKKEIQALVSKKGITKKRYLNKFNKGLTPRKVLELYKDDILKKFGKYKSIEDVQEFVLNKFDLDVNRRAVEEFFLRNEDEIKKIRGQWSSKLDDFRLVKKRGRVEELSYLYSKNKDIFKESNNVARSKEMRYILGQIKEEVEGNRIHLDINQNIDVNLTLNSAKSMAELLKNVSVSSIVVAMIAAKKKVNPTSIVAQLMGSHYAQANGFGGVLSKEEEDIIDPRLMVYDFDNIKRTYRSKPENNLEYTDYEEVDEDISNKVLSKKEQLLKKLKS